MKILNFVLLCVVLLLLISACSEPATPSPSTEMPDTLTRMTPTTSAASPTITPLLPTATEQPSAGESSSTPTLAPPVPSLEGFLLENVGFATPESILYDKEADVYLVANINGSPSAQDDNGFIARVSPAGDMIDLKWIDGADSNVTLNAPKGMTLTSAGLYVADIDAVRLFERETGEFLQEFPVPGAVFLNDVTSDAEELVYVSDSSAGGLYAITLDGTVETIMPAGGIQGPNGLAVWDGVLYVASGNGIFAIENGTMKQAFSVPQGGLDGLIFLDGDNILVSSWSANAVYHVTLEGQAIEVVSGVPSPADIGFDATRGYILIPLFNGNAIDARPLP